MSDWREIAYEADRDSGSEYGGEDFDTEIARLRARIRELEQQLADRDAAWERAIQSLAQQGVMMVDDPIAAVRFWMETDGGGA